MRKHQLDLSSHLQKKQQNQQIKQIFSIGLVLSLITGLSVGGLALVVNNLPWHWQLFIRWIFKKGDVTEIPQRLYKPLSHLCDQAKHGYVDGYQGSEEIAYSLGKFQCRTSPGGDRWLIQDIYQFDNLREAQAGSPLAILIVDFLGKNYAYKIVASIPKVHN